jgi:hypothetical protein
MPYFLLANRRRDDDDDYDRGYGRGNNKRQPPRANSYDSHEGRREREGDRARERGRGGNVSDDEGDDRRQKGNNGKGQRYVSPEAYDELSALCDRLMAQQEQLQIELSQQANVIKVTNYYLFVQLEYTKYFYN